MSPRNTATAEANDDSLVDDRLTALLGQLNAFGNLLSNGQDPIVEVWHQVRAEFDSRRDSTASTSSNTVSPPIADFIFASWAISHVSEIVLSFICDRLYTHEISQLGRAARSRLKVISELFTVSSPICWFVLEKQATNESILFAFRALRVEQPELSLQGYCQRAMALREDVGKRGHVFTRQTLIRETFKTISPSLWSRRSNLSKKPREPGNLDAHLSQETDNAVNDNDAKDNNLNGNNVNNHDFDDHNLNISHDHDDTRQPTQADHDDAKQSGRADRAVRTSSCNNLHNANQPKPGSETVESSQQALPRSRASGLREAENIVDTTSRDASLSEPKDTSVDIESDIETSRRYRHLGIQDMNSIEPASPAGSLASTDTQLDLVSPFSRFEHRGSIKRPAIVLDDDGEVDCDAGLHLSGLRSPLFRKSRRQSRDSTLDDPVLPLPRSITHTETRRAIASLDTVYESVTRCLASEQFLNDLIVNTAVSRLASAQVGIVDSLCLESKSGQTTIAGVINCHDMILFPVCDRIAQHWRLYCWTAPSTIAVYDPCKGLQDTTTSSVKDLFSVASGHSAMRVVEESCPQQHNRYDCGVFVIEVARALATNHALSAITMAEPSRVLRNRLLNSLLTSVAATLPPRTLSSDKLTTMTILWKRFHLHRCLADTPSPFIAAAADNTRSIELEQSGLDLLQFAADDMHALHRKKLARALELDAETCRRTAPLTNTYAGFDLLQAFCQVRNAIPQSDLTGGLSRNMSAAEVSVQLHVEAIEKELKGEEERTRREVHDLYGQAVALMLILRKIKSIFQTCQLV